MFAYQDRERLSVGMRFSVPAGRVVRLLDAEAVIRLSDRPDALVARFDEVTSMDADHKLATISVSTTMTGASRPARGRGDGVLLGSELVRKAYFEDVSAAG